MTTAAASALRLPDAIADLDLKLAKALTTPVPEIWPEGEKFLPANCPEAVATVLIQSRLHSRLVNASMAYVFREEITQSGRVKGGVASKASGKLAYFTGHDFVIEFSHTVWLRLTHEQRIALVDHELAHCERDSESEAWIMRDHDVEEFSDIVGRWGLWTPNLQGFGRAIAHAQIDLFAGVTGVGNQEEEEDDR